MFLTVKGQPPKMTKHTQTKLFSFIAEKLSSFTEKTCRRTDLKNEQFFSRG